MNYLDWQLDRFAQGGDQPALIWRDQAATYRELAALHPEWLERLAEAGITSGDVVAVVGDFSPASVSALLALARLGCLLVPLARDSQDQHAEFFRIAEVDQVVNIDGEDRPSFQAVANRQRHPLLEQLRLAGEPGLVLFSSGSTGNPKAILHSLPRLLEKFRKPRHALRTLSFLLFDHIGGFNTMCYTLANLGTLVPAPDRSVVKVCEAIQRHKVQLLPTSPSFLNLLLLAQAHQAYDLSSLELVTYGTEVMPERTLKMANEALPHVRFQQTYGLSELGILRSKSAGNDSLLVKVGGEDYETKVVDGTLRIRASSSMVGYLNAPSPFDAEGWFDTGDAVLEDNGYYRILGRQSEIINVGGQKVYPTEVEKVVAELPGVIDVAVSGEAHLLLGQIVVATVQTSLDVSAVEWKKRIAQHSKGRLQPFMVPSKVRVVNESPVNYRFKKIRR